MKNSRQSCANHHVIHFQLGLTRAITSSGYYYMVYVSKWKSYISMEQLIFERKTFSKQKVLSISSTKPTLTQESTIGPAKQITKLAQKNNEFTVINLWLKPASKTHQWIQSMMDSPSVCTRPYSIICDLRLDHADYDANEFGQFRLYRIFIYIRRYTSHHPTHQTSIEVSNYFPHCHDVGRKMRTWSRIFNIIKFRSPIISIMTLAPLKWLKWILLRNWRITYVLTKSDDKSM